MTRNLLIVATGLLVGACTGSGNLNSTDDGNAHGGDPAVVGDAAPDADADTDGAADVDVLPRPLAGIYELTGSDSVWGSYTGTVEVRDAGGGLYDVIHLQRWTTALFEGERIALVWVGSLDTSAEWVSVELEPVGFVTEYGGESRTGVDPSPVAFTAPVVGADFETLTLAFVSDRAGVPGFDEGWRWQSASGAQPIWQNARTLEMMHAQVPEATRQSLFATYASFHQLPEVAPYVADPQFGPAMHYVVRDRTDLDFYRSNPDTLRVIQRIVDPIALAEARLRNRAFRYTLAEKAALFDLDMPQYHLNEADLFSSYEPGAATFSPSYDATLWTGVYGASQALRYLATSDPVAWTNMLRALDGLFLCVDIAPTAGDFARAVRPYGSAADSYVRGLPPYEAWEWRPGANNDMFKGFVVGFAWSWLAIRQAGGEPMVEAKMIGVIEELRDSSPIGGDGRVNEMLLHLLHWMMTGDLGSWLDYQALFVLMKPFYVDAGNGSFLEYGSSDWSGNHLILQGLLTGWLVADDQQDANLADFERGLRNSLDNLRDTRLGLFQLVAGSKGNFASPPAELAAAVEVLEEFPYPKLRYAIDWRIHPSFVMSPFPNLPWKDDWESTDRTDGIHSYPLFERQISEFGWKDNPLRYKGSATSALSHAGADYLFAYWFARYYSLAD